MKKILLLLVILALSLCLFSCGEEKYYDENYVYDGKSLIGIWQERDINYEDYYTYEFFADGKMELRQFIYGMEIGTEVGEYTVKDGKIEVLFREDDGRISTLENKFSITQDGKLILLRLDPNGQMSEVEAVYVPYEPVFNLEKALVGTWENLSVEDELWIFDSDFMITIPDEIKEEKMLYSTKGDTVYMLYLIDSGEHKLFLETPMIFEFSIEGDTLEMTGDFDGVKQTLTFKKK